MRLVEAGEETFHPRVALPPELRADLLRLRDLATEPGSVEPAKALWKELQPKIRKLGLTKQQALLAANVESVDDTLARYSPAFRAKFHAEVKKAIEGDARWEGQNLRIMAMYQGLSRLMDDPEVAPQDGAALRDCFLQAMEDSNFSVINRPKRKKPKPYDTFFDFR